MVQVGNMKNVILVYFLLLFAMRLTANCALQYNIVVSKIDKRIGYTGVDHIRIGVHKGKPLSKRSLGPLSTDIFLKSPSAIPAPSAETSISYLGGFASGNVYRYTNKNGESINLKSYKTKENLELDLQLMSFINFMVLVHKPERTQRLFAVKYKKLTMNVFEQYSKFFSEVSKTEILKENIVIITPSVRGRSFYDLKKSFLTETQLVNFENYMKEVFLGFKYADVSNSLFTLHSKNVIIEDKTHNIWIIDPR